MRRAKAMAESTSAKEKPRVSHQPRGSRTGKETREFPSQTYQQAVLDWVPDRLSGIDLCSLAYSHAALAVC